MRLHQELHLPLARDLDHELGEPALGSRVQVDLRLLGDDGRPRLHEVGQHEHREHLGDPEADVHDVGSPGTADDDEFVVPRLTLALQHQLVGHPESLEPVRHAVHEPLGTAFLARALFLLDVVAREQGVDGRRAALSEVAGLDPAPQVAALGGLPQRAQIGNVGDRLPDAQRQVLHLGSRGLEESDGIRRERERPLRLVSLLRGRERLRRTPCRFVWRFEKIGPFALASRGEPPARTLEFELLEVQLSHVRRVDRGVGRPHVRGVHRGETEAEFVRRPPVVDDRLGGADVDEVHGLAAEVQVEGSVRAVEGLLQEERHLQNRSLAGGVRAEKECDRSEFDAGSPELLAPRFEVLDTQVGQHCRASRSRGHGPGGTLPPGQPRKMYPRPERRTSRANRSPRLFASPCVPSHDRTPRRLTPPPPSA